MKYTLRHRGPWISDMIKRIICKCGLVFIPIDSYECPHCDYNNGNQDIYGLWVILSMGYPICHCQCCGSDVHYQWTFCSQYCHDKGALIC